MKYLMTILMIFTLSVAFADDDPNGECRKLFKAAKNNIKNATNTLENIDSLYYKQERALVSKNTNLANRITKQIIQKLESAKSNFKSAVPQSSRAMSKCSGRSGKAQKLLIEAKTGIEETVFKIRINNGILTNN